MPRCARCAARCSRPTSRSTWSEALPIASASRRSAPPSSSRSRPARWWSRSSMTNWSTTLGADGQTIDLNAVPPVAIMMVGLQGSGKTTTTAKLARRMTQRDKRKVLMASLDVYRPAAMEQLAVLGRDLDIPDAADRGRPEAAADRAPRDGSRQARRLRRGAARHRRPHHARRRHDERGGGDQSHRQPARSAAGCGRPHRPGRGQSGARVRSARRPHRHRADTCRRRRPRRRGAVDARGHRQADQADRHR